jgi:hypothetical protein
MNCRRARRLFLTPRGWRGREDAGFGSHSFWPEVAKLPEDVKRQTPVVPRFAPDWLEARAGIASRRERAQSICDINY